MFRSRAITNCFGHLLFLCLTTFIANIKASYCTPQQNCLCILNVFPSNFMQSAPYTLTKKKWMCALAFL